MLLSDFQVKWLENCSLLRCPHFSLTIRRSFLYSYPLAFPPPDQSGDKSAGHPKDHGSDTEMGEMLLRVRAFIYLLIYLFSCCTACGILVPWPGIEPGAPAVKVPSPNHWTAREFPRVRAFESDRFEIRLRCRGRVRVRVRGPGNLYFHKRIERLWCITGFWSHGFRWSLLAQGVLYSWKILPVSGFSRNEP